MYYLQSRYYDASVGRFVNADNVNLLIYQKEIASLNLFAYCINNAINLEDTLGLFSLKKAYKCIEKYLSWGWTYIAIKLPYELSLAIGLWALAYRLFSIGGDIKKINSITGSRIATAVAAALPYGSAYLSNEIINYICNFTLFTTILSATLSLFTTVITGGAGTIIKTLITFLLSYVIPSLIASIQMIYYGVKKKRVVYTKSICWEVHQSPSNQQQLKRR